MGRSPILRILLAALVATVALAQLLPGTSSSFTGTTDNTGNAVSAAADWTGPTVTATTLQKSEGGIADTIRQNGGFYVYANASDSGNPASGVASITASVGTIATVSTATMTSGSWTVGGTTYGWRSGLLTAKATLASGSYSWSATGTDTAGNAGSAASDTVTVDNTAFDGDTMTWDDNGTAARFDTGDNLQYFFSKTVDPDSIVDGWDGSAMTVKAAFYDAAVYNTTSDIVAVGNTALSAQYPVGTGYLGGDYVAASGTGVYNATMTASGNKVNVLLGTAASGSANLKTATTQALGSWTEMATPFDAAGNVALNNSIAWLGGTGLAMTNRTGGTSGKAEAGDRIAFTYNRAPQLSGQTVTVRFTDNASNDAIAVYDGANTTAVPLGTVATAGNYVNANVTFASSTLTVSGGTVTITLGTPSSTSALQTDTAKRVPTWTPSKALTDAAGAGVSTVPYRPASSLTAF